jgi:FkbM family methyltransferase
MDTCLAGLAARGLSPACIIDVGAADGAWTRMARAHWPDARYVLFEPLAERAAELDRLAGEFPGITWHNCGLGRARSKLDLSISADLFISSFAYGGASSRQVAVETLDLLQAEGTVPPGDFIKIDVQGFELEVLAGAEEFIRSTQVVIMETYYHRFAPRMSLVHEAVALMHQKGFRVYEILDQLRRPYDNAVGQCDICFVREGHDLLRCNSW